MNSFDIDSTELQQCDTRMGRFAGNAFLFLLGGSIGAALALLFAPKPGIELREEIAQAASKGYAGTIDAAGTLKRRTGEYLDVAKDTGKKVLDIASLRMSRVREGLDDDAEAVGEIVEKGMARLTPSASAGPTS